MEDEEYKKLPFLDQCMHKSWKVRVNGYEELTKLFRQIHDRKSTEFAKYLGHVTKFVIDSNAMGQEKGLEAVLAYVENYANAGKTVGEVIPAIVAKCIASPRSNTRELALQITLMYIEIEKQNAVVEELLKGMELKNPKIVAACIGASTTALRVFGCKVINLKPFLKKIPVLFADRDKAVRDEAGLLVIEMYRWIGIALRPHLSKLQPVRVCELEAEFLKIEEQKASPTRYLRSQQKKQTKNAVEQEGDTGADREKVVEAAIEPFALMDPVEILSKLSYDFYEKCESKKWPERKGALETLEDLVKAPKLEAGDYGDLVRALKKIVQKDNNVIVVALAAKCLTGLASGLKKKFNAYVSICIPVLLEKFKEKKHNVVAAVRDAVDSIYLTTTLENILEDVLEALNYKNPSVKTETALFLSRSFAKTKVLHKKLLKPLTLGLIKLINEPDPSVRDSAAEALGALMKLVGEKTMDPFFTELKKDTLKMGKIKEYFERPIAIVEVPQKTLVKADVPVSTQEAASSVTKAAEKPGTAPPHVKKEQDNGRSPLLVANNMKEQRTTDESELKVLKWNFTYPNKEYVNLLKEQMTEANINKMLIDKMFHSDFKYHLKAIEMLKKDLPVNIQGLISNLDLILKWLTLEFFNMNPSVLVKSFDYLHCIFNLLAENKYRLLEIEASNFIPYLISKFGDSNESVRNEVRSLLKEIYIIYGISKLFSYYVLEGLKSGNACLQVECLGFMGELIIDFGLNICLPTREVCMKQVGKWISNGDDAVRDAALHCAVQAFYNVGKKIFELLGEISDKDKLLLEERIKVAGKTACSPKITSFERNQQPHHQAAKTTVENDQKMDNILEENGVTLPSRIEEVTASQEEESLPSPEAARTKYLHLPSPEAARAQPILLCDTWDQMGQEREIYKSIVINISQIASQNSATAIQAMQQIVQLNEVSLLVEYEDLFLTAITDQLKHLKNYDHKNADALKVYRYLLSITFDFTQHPNLLQEVTIPVLKNFMYQFTLLLLDKLDDYVYKYVDKLLSLIISQTPMYTNSICALIQLLHYCVKTNASSSQTEIVMKYLWQMIKNMPEAKYEIKYDLVLLEVHMLLKDFPIVFLKKNPVVANTPLLRTIYTLIHAMGKILGCNLPSRLSLIPNTNDSEIESIIFKVLKTISTSHRIKIITTSSAA